MSSVTSRDPKQVFVLIQILGAIPKHAKKKSLKLSFSVRGGDRNPLSHNNT